LLNPERLFNPEGQVDAEDRRDTSGQRCPGEPHRAADAIAIGEAEGGETTVSSYLDQGLRARGAVSE
jgi:hypothetical protein